jgi:hypothetical protein
MLAYALPRHSTPLLSDWRQLMVIEVYLGTGYTATGITGKSQWVLLLRQLPPISASCTDRATGKSFEREAARLRKRAACPPARRCPPPRPGGAAPVRPLPRVTHRLSVPISAFMEHGQSNCTVRAIHAICAALTTQDPIGLLTLGV